MCMCVHVHVYISDMYMYMHLNALVLEEVIFKPLVCVHVSLSLMVRMLETETSN